MSDKRKISLDEEIKDKNDQIKVKAADVIGKEAINKRIKLSVEELQSEKIKELQEQVGVLSKEKNDIKVECPVCMEVPTSEPIHVCPNGHFVCSTCKQAKCPTCRSKILARKSLLAAVVIENIEHKCKHDDCEELLSIQEYQMHLDTCAHNPANRVVFCPASRELCGKKMELSKIFLHIETGCEGSWNAESEATDIFVSLSSGIPWDLALDVPMLAEKGLAIECDGSHFYLSMSTLPVCRVFSIQCFGNRFECEKFVVDLSVHRFGDTELKGKLFLKLLCEPLPIDVDHNLKQTNGLMIGFQQLEKIARFTEYGDSSIFISLIINRI